MPKTKSKLNRKAAMLYASALHMELLLDVTAQIADTFTQFSNALTSEIAQAAGDDGIVLSHRILGVQDFANRELGQLIEFYRHMLDDAMETTVGYVQGAHLVLYDYYLGDRILEESKGDGGFGDAFDIDKDKYPHVEMFNTRQREQVINAARARTYGDRFNLSDRIWNLENGGREKINQRLLQAIANKESAVSLQKDLDEYLKPDARYTRWTRNRLYGMTSAERLTGERGLIRKPRQIDPSVGPPTKGMAYNAMRLARNEIQQVHWDVYENTVETMPWVEKIAWMLSAAHPRSDVCDGLANGGPYEKGSVPSRPHPLCYCWLRSLLMSKDEFLDKVRGWTKGENHFLDEYAQQLGYAFDSIVKLTVGLAAEDKQFSQPRAS
ncbi:MAG: hypothetical protein M1548_09945, partial [Actinobacteria bacterium]|nr:hypothetical protein [Actinomycetota bacterium]